MVSEIECIKQRFEMFNQVDAKIEGDYLKVFASAIINFSKYDSVSQYEMVNTLYYELAGKKIGNLKIGAICLPNKQETTINDLHEYMYNHNEQYHDLYSDEQDVWYVSLTFKLEPTKG